MLGGNLGSLLYADVSVMNTQKSISRSTAEKFHNHLFLLTEHLVGSLVKRRPINNDLTTNNFLSLMVQSRQMHFKPHSLVKDYNHRPLTAKKLTKEVNEQRFVFSEIIRHFTFNMMKLDKVRRLFFQDIFKRSVLRG